MMNAKKSATALVFLTIASWHCPTLLNFQNTSCSAYEVRNNNISFNTIQNENAFYVKATNTQTSEPNILHKTNLKTNTNGSELVRETKSPRDLKEILSRYYEGNNFVVQERAFRRVIQWKMDVEGIARHYNHVDWKKLSAVIKAETQGRTGRQESRAKAVGMTQIKYQGAWAFLWDVMFSEKIKQGSQYVKDYHNEGIRRRYRDQLHRIKQHLKENDILVFPANSSEKAYNTAKFESWKNLKRHLRRSFEPGEYQVAVDISAMYLDHLRCSFSKMKSHVSEIRDQIEKTGSTEDPNFSGTTGIWWKRIKRSLEQDVEFTENANIQQRTVAHLNNVIKRLEDPDIDLAAYNYGISKVLGHIHSGKALPNTIERYVEEVAMYRAIFSEIEQFGVMS